MNNNPSLWSWFNYGSASILEIIWTVIGTIGLLAVAWLLREALLDRRAVGRVIGQRTNAEERIVAAQNVRRTGQKLVCFLVFVGIGVVFCLTPSPMPPTHQEGPGFAAVFLSSGLVLVEVLLTVSAIQDRRDRLAVLSIMRMKRKGDGDADTGLLGTTTVPE